MPNYLPSFAGCGEPRIDANSGGNGGGGNSGGGSSRTYDHELCNPSKAHQRVWYDASLHSCIAAGKSDMREPHCGI